MTDRIPPPRGFLDAVLHVLAAHPDGIRRKQIHEPVADRMDLSPEQRAIRLPSGAHLAYRHRIGWAITMLKRAGLAQSVAHGVWGITADGVKLVGDRPSGLTKDDIRDIARASREFGNESETPTFGDSEADEPTATDLTPDEQIDRAVNVIRRGLARDLLDHIAQCSPDFFETLVLDLLHAMGYGTDREALQRVGGSGDGGIDGVITLDKLGLEKVYVQAKRWKGTVGRPEIQGFYGALAGRRARKGVFITTSSYSREATEFADSVSDSIVLVDGTRLAQLMIDHGVGVHRNRTVHIPTLDSDYFDDA
ncbi:MAG: restriction endonuclease [Myxococcales bacterium]|nr:restriction endonuclease [Myxococcales bacterium]